MTFQAVRQWVAFKRGSRLLGKGRWQPAADLLGRAVRLAPDHWEAHHNLTIALLKLGRWEEAAGMAQRAILLNPRAAESHDFFGIALLQLDRWDEAVAAYRRALAVDPTRYDSHDRLGMALWRLERWEDLVKACEAALKVDAGRYSLHHRLGMALLRISRWDAAATALRRAIELAADDPGATADLPGLLSHLASAEARRAAPALTPAPAQDVTARLTRAVNLLKLERWAEAAVELSEGSVLTPSAVGCWHYLQVDALVRLGRFPEAVAAHQRAVAAGGPLPQLPLHPSSARFARRQAAFWTEANLGPEVFAVERWLERLTVVPDQVAPGPGLLFVLDHDFGELTTVKYFVLGQALAGRTTLLLPERLYAHNPDAIPGRTRRYGSVAEILAAVEQERPAIVFLCSGYLLCEHLGFTPGELAHLVDRLRARECRVVTTDPFLGLLSKQDPRTLIRIDIPTSHPVWTVEQLTETKRPDEERLWASYTQSEQILRDTYHLYPSHCDGAEERDLAFFNDRLQRGGPTTTVAPTNPHWLFVLSRTDCQTQMLFEGETGFADLLARKLVETLAAGRHPILVAPNELVDVIVQRMPTAEGIDILSHRPFAQFLSLLLSAEQVFYWNAVSHSLLIRLYNQLPIVLFDRGHLVRNAPAIYARLVAWYYQGWEPSLRNHREPLTLPTVDDWTVDSRRRAGRLVERYRRAPSPEKMIAELMRRAPIPDATAKVAPVGGGLF